MRENQNLYITCVVSELNGRGGGGGIKKPSAEPQMGRQSKWQHNPCRLVGAHYGEEIKVAT